MSELVRVGVQVGGNNALCLAYHFYLINHGGVFGSHFGLDKLEKKFAFVILQGPPPPIISQLSLFLIIPALS